MTGPEVSVEAITVNGKTEIVAITDKEIIGNGNFTEIGHRQPSTLPMAIQHEIRDVVCRTVAAIGIDHSPSHTELKVTPTGVKVVEIGARLGGDNITTHLVPLSTGVDLVEICLDISVGNPVTQYSACPNTSAIRYFQPDCGVITEISGVEEARQLACVKEICLLRGVGDQVPSITSSTDRIGFVIAQGCGEHTAEEICSQAVNQINIKVRSKS